MKFSVVMPCYNSERYIATAIESVLKQSYSDWELVVIDDGSTDTSSAVVERYQANDHRIKLVKQLNSGKPAIARNNGIRLVTGDILCFLDSDDNYEPDRFAIVASFFNTNPEVDFIFHDYDLIDQHGSRVRKNELKTKTAALLQFYPEPADYVLTSDLYNYFLQHGCLVHTSTICIKLQSCTNTNLYFDENLTCAEDLLYWFKLAATGKGAYVNKSLSCYRDTPASISKNKALVDEDTASFYLHLLQHPPKKLNAGEKKRLKELVSTNFLSAAYHSSLQGNKAHACKLSLWAFAFRPSTATLFDGFKSMFRKPLPKAKLQ